MFPREQHNQISSTCRSYLRAIMAQRLVMGRTPARRRGEVHDQTPRNIAP